MSTCTWGAGRPGKPIYLLGDSNAQMYSEALIEAGKDLGRPVVIGTMGGCPMVEVQYDSPAETESHLVACEDWIADAGSWLGGMEPGTVVLAAASESITDEEQAMRVPGGEWASDPDAKATVWEKGLAASIATVRKAGDRVVLVSTLPHFTNPVTDWWTPASCSNLAWLQNRPQDCSPSAALASEDQRQAGTLAAEKAASQDSGATLLDIRPIVCPDGVCRAYSDGLWLYRDGLHVSPAGSTSLAPAFVDALR